MSDHTGILRSVLPIPARQQVGLTTCDAKDPDAKFPSVEPLHPPEGAPNVLLILLDVVAGPDDADHLRLPEERLRVAMARQ